MGVNALFVYDFHMIRTGILLGWIALLVAQQPMVPYHATPADVVDRMLALAQVTKDDVVLDLGCGDGRIPIRAAQKYGARGIGVDIDPKLIELSRENARKAGVEHLVEFRVEDALKTDVTPASVVTLYMLSSFNAKLRPILWANLRPGSRVVSHAFSMGREWPADQIDRFTNTDGDQVTLYLWRPR